MKLEIVPPPEGYADDPEDKVVLLRDVSTNQIMWIGTKGAMAVAKIIVEAVNRLAGTDDA